MFKFLKGNSRNNFDAFEKEVFQSWGVSRPSDAQKLRLRLAFVSCAVAIVHRSAGDAGAHVIRKIQEDVVQSSREFSVVISDLFDVEIPSHSIDFSMEDFIEAVDQPGLGVGAKTKINGLAAIDGLFVAFGQDGASWVHDHSSGPFGPNGAAALFMHDLTLGGRSDGPSSLMVAKAFGRAIVNMSR